MAKTDLIWGRRSSTSGKERWAESTLLALQSVASSAEEWYHLPEDILQCLAILLAIGCMPARVSWQPPGRFSFAGQLTHGCILVSASALRQEDAHVASSDDAAQQHCREQSSPVL